MSGLSRWAGSPEAEKAGPKGMVWPIEVESCQRRKDKKAEQLGSLEPLEPYPWAWFFRSPFDPGNSEIDLWTERPAEPVGGTKNTGHSEMTVLVPSLTRALELY